MLILEHVTEGWKLKKQVMIGWTVSRLDTEQHCRLQLVESWLFFFFFVLSPFPRVHTLDKLNSKVKDWKLLSVIWDTLTTVIFSFLVHIHFPSARGSSMA